MKGRLGMKKFNITISREFGCNSREITRMLASRLGVEMYDRDLVDMAARKAGINLDEFADADKVIDSSVEKLTRRFGYDKAYTGVCIYNRTDCCCTCGCCHDKYEKE